MSRDIIEYLISLPYDASRGTRLTYFYLYFKALDDDSSINVLLI